ncbi:MAG: hypothetical protein F4160_05380 [Rhodospirillaceae bacterium]|nr:hypothetical protein [Rhodospirillaceae bacterium]
MNENNFEREKICYQQNFEQARSLNSQMNRVPVLAMTLTGGLWFAAGIAENLHCVMRFALLLFAGFCNLALIAAVLRIRDVIQSYLEKLKDFHPDGYVGGKSESSMVPWLSDYSMIVIFCALMGIGSLLSFGGAFAFYCPFGGGE